ATGGCPVTHSIRGCMQQLHAEARLSFENMGDISPRRFTYPPACWRTVSRFLTDEMMLILEFRWERSISMAIDISGTIFMYLQGKPIQTFPLGKAWDEVLHKLDKVQLDSCNDAIIEELGGTPPV